MGNIINKQPKDSVDEILSLETPNVTSALKRVQTSGSVTPRNTALWLSEQVAKVENLEIENTPPTGSGFTNLIVYDPADKKVKTVDGTTLFGNTIPQNYNVSAVDEIYELQPEQSGQEFDFNHDNNSKAQVDFISDLPDGFWCIISVIDGQLELNSVSGSLEFVDEANNVIAAPAYEENLTLFITVKRRSSTNNVVRVVRW